MLTVLREGPYAVLTGRLAEAVAATPSLGAARDVLLLPIELLSALGRDAEAALGDDPLAAERMRALLCAAGPTAIPPSATEALAEPEPEAATEREPGVPADAAMRGSVLHPGALVVIGLAAGRAGARVGLGPQLVNTVLGLALAAGPAEGLAQLGGVGLAGQQLHALLGGLSAPGQTTSGLSLAVAAFLTDPLQRTRWRSLKDLFARVTHDVGRTRWDGADAGEITRVEAHEHPSRVVRIRADLPEARWRALRRGEVHVVFASASARTTRAAKLLDMDPPAGVLDVEAPLDVRCGWLGLDDRTMRGQSNDDRAALRERWQEHNRTLPLLAAAPVPVAAISLLHDPATPPRLAGNRFDGGLPDVHHASLAPPRAPAGGTLTLEWAVDGASSVLVEPPRRTFPAEGRVALRAPAEVGEVVVTVTGNNVRGRTSARLTTEVVDPRVLATLALVDPEPLRVVFVRPAVFATDGAGAATFARVTEAELRAAVKEAQRRLGTLIDATEPAWVDDEDLALDGPVEAVDAPGVAEMLERVSLLSARHAGREDAVWIALLPRGRAPILTSIGAEAARAVIVATADRLEAALGAPSWAPLAPSAPRLRLVGVVDRRNVVQLDAVRTETRAVGPGAGVDTGLFVVGLDAHHKEVSRKRVTSPTATVPRTFAAFLAVAPDVVSFEFRHAGSVLFRATRPASPPSLARVDIDAGHAAWSYRSGPTSALRATVEVRAQGMWSPIAHARGHASAAPRVPLPASRVRPYDAVRVVASDGWNTDVMEVGHASHPRRSSVVARYAGRGRWWADTDHGGHAVWSCGGRTFEGPSIVLPPGTTDALRVAVRDHGEEVFDVRTT